MCFAVVVIYLLLYVFVLLSFDDNKVRDLVAREMPDELDVYRLIEEVKVRPTLWDYRFAEYKDRTNTPHKWNEIAKALGADGEFVKNLFAFFSFILFFSFYSLAINKQSRGIYYGIPLAGCILKISFPIKFIIYFFSFCSGTMQTQMEEFA